MSSENQQQKSDISGTEQNVAEETPMTNEPPLMDRSILLIPKRTDFITMQSIPLTNDPNIRRSPRVKEENQLFGTLHKGCYTIHDLFMHGYDVNHDAQCIGWRPTPTEPYKWLKYHEVYEMIRRIGSALIAKGAKPNPTQLLGIYAMNGVPWFVFDKACSAYSMVSVPLYDSLGPEALTHIVNQCELSIVLVDKNVNAMKLLNDAKEGKTSTLKLLVIVEDVNDEVRSLSEETSIEMITFEQLQKLGETCLQEFVPPQPDDLFTISYTSGTTGAPKGAMQTHKNGVAMISAYMAHTGDYLAEYSSEDVLLSYLPLAHVIERYFECGVIANGGSIGYFYGDPKKLLDDAAALKPTVFPMVPRVLNRFYARVNSLVGESGLKRALFDFCLARKMAALRKGVVVNNSIWDKILFHKFQAAVGGRVKHVVTAAAPISAEVLNLVRCVLGVQIIEGYGQTESSGATTVTIFGDYTGGNVGSILPNSIMKLVDVPEKEYYAKDNKGEVCCKGLSIFQGYYKDEVKTKEAIDEDGWLHTGDIGEWLPDGSLKIIDRRKHIFKLSIGEYIAPEKIEQIYQLCAIVEQVFIHGYSLKSEVVGIVVPAEEYISEWCKSKNLDVAGKSYADICRMDEVSHAILEEMDKKGRQLGLKSFELAKRIYVSPELFTVENEMLTPTFKTRRPNVEKRYKESIDKMYADLEK